MWDPPLAGEEEKYQRRMAQVAAGDMPTWFGPRANEVRAAYGLPPWDSGAPASQPERQPQPQPQPQAQPQYHQPQQQQQQLQQFQPRPNVADQGMNFFGGGGAGDGPGYVFGGNSRANANNNSFGNVNNNNNNINMGMQEYVLTSTHPVGFELLPQANAYSITHGLRLRVHHGADITFVPMTENPPVEANRYQYLMRSAGNIHYWDHAALRAQAPVFYEHRLGAINNTPSVYPLPPENDMPATPSPSNLQSFEFTFPVATAEANTATAPTFPPASASSPAAPVDSVQGSRGRGYGIRGVRGHRNSSRQQPRAAATQYDPANSSPVAAAGANPTTTTTSANASSPVAPVDSVRVSRGGRGGHHPRGGRGQQPRRGRGRRNANTQSSAPPPPGVPANPKWRENECYRTIWDKDKKGNARKMEDNVAPTHYECKVCPPMPPGRPTKKQRTENPAQHSQLEPFRGRWGEAERHFMSSRSDHLEVWNRVMKKNLGKTVCTFPKINKGTGRAEVDQETGAMRICGYSHGRREHVEVDHKTTVHNAEAPGDPRAYSRSVRHMRRKRVACRRAIVHDELEALVAVRQRIRRLEEELAARGRGTNTPYVSVHGLDVQTDWTVGEKESGYAATAVRLRRLAGLRGRRQFRSDRRGSWHQVADDLEAGLHPGSRLAQALDALRLSQAGQDDDDDDEEEEDEDEDEEMGEEEEEEDGEEEEEEE